jgi:hypothetical protein
MDCFVEVFVSFLVVLKSEVGLTAQVIDIIYVDALRIGRLLNSNGEAVNGFVQALVGPGLL